MEIGELIEGLSRPDAYPNTPGPIGVCQTHISVVFLAGDSAYKIKKPVDFGFVDFRELGRRRFFCEREVDLNRRLAPSVYHGVVPVTCRDGRPRIGSEGDPVEWAVHMRRLPNEATFEHRLAAGSLGRDDVAGLAVRLVAFHAAAEGGAAVSEFGRWRAVADNALENFRQTAGHVGVTVSPEVYERVRARTEAELDRLRRFVEDRARCGVPRDTHGDLRLEHVYALPDGLAVIDCVEFNDRFRFADPVSDVAFLVMDLASRGRRDLARAFADAYFDARRDDDGRALLDFYSAYRSVVRAKVRGLKATAPEVPAGERADALTRARMHWLLAAVLLGPPDSAPALVLMGGLPGSGKSTVARALADAAGFTVVRSDVVRKRLGAADGDAIYSPEWNRRTYDACLEAARQELWHGRRVIVDANFRRDGDRVRFLDAAVSSGVPGLFVECRVPPEVARARLDGRNGDASDADWEVYQRLAGEWEPVGEGTARSAAVLDGDGPAEVVAGRALGLLRGAGLA